MLHLSSDETGPDKVTRWTVRLLAPSGNISSVGGFQAHDSYGEALCAMNDLQ